MQPGKLCACVTTALAFAIGVALAPAMASTAPASQSGVGVAADGGAQSTADTTTKLKAARRKKPLSKEQAREKNATTLQTTTVTPIRFSLESAQEMQRESQNQINVIVASDIGKFPGNDVSAALSHISGIQVTYLEGQANNVTMRGLPDVSTTLNGRNVFSTTSRHFQFSYMPAEAVGSIEAYKSNSANLPEGGISGSINVKTRQPFDYTGFKAEAQFRSEHSEIGGSNAPDANVFLSDRWHTDIGEFGALFSAQYYRNDFVRIRSLNSTRVTFVNPQDHNTILVPDVFETQNETGQRTRKAFNYDLQWKPMDHLVLDAGGFYSKEYLVDASQELEMAPREATSASNLVTYGPGTPGGCATVTPGVNQCSLISGTFNSPKTEAIMSALPGGLNRSAVGQYWLGAKWNTDSFTADSSVAATVSNGLSTTYSAETGLTTPGLSGPTVLNAVVQGPGGKPVYQLVGNPQLNKNSYILRNFSPSSSNSRALDTSWKNDFSYYLHDGFLQRIDAGFVYSYLSASGAQYGGQTGNGPSNVSVESILPGFQSLSPNLGNYLTPSQYYAPSASYIISHLSQLEALVKLPVGAQVENPTGAFQDHERELAAYLQGSYGFSLGDIPVDGLFGVREVKTQRYLLSNKVLKKVVSPISADKQSYTSLPNVSADVHLTEDLQLRLSAAKTLSEPSFSDLSPQTTLSVHTQVPGQPAIQPTGSGGNPELQPIRSTNYDATLAWYFGRASSVSMAAFYHKLQGYTERYGSNETIDGVDYFVTRPQSGGSGRLEGWEFDYQQFFSFLPAPFDGLGTKLTYAYVLGSTQSPVGTSGPTVTPLTGVSKHNYNAEIFYEKHGWSVHLGYQYRSFYLDSLSAGGQQYPQTLYVAGNGRLNVGVDYDVNRRVTLVLDGSNILHSNYRSYYGSKLNPFEYDFRDTTYSLGVRVEF